MKPLKKGDPCRVRLHNGEVVKAAYGFSLDSLDGAHFVKFGGRFLCATSSPAHDFECRFVGNPCALVPAGMSL